MQCYTVIKLKLTQSITISLCSRSGPFYLNTTSKTVELEEFYLIGSTQKYEKAVLFKKCYTKDFYYLSVPTDHPKSVPIYPSLTHSYDGTKHNKAGV